MELRDQIQEWMVKGNNRAPQLTAILIGDDPASRTYVNNKMKVMTRFVANIIEFLISL